MARSGKRGVYGREPGGTESRAKRDSARVAAATKYRGQTKRVGSGQATAGRDHETGDSGQETEFRIRFAGTCAVGYSSPMSTLAEIEQAAKVLPVDQKQRLVASLLAGLRKEDISKVAVDEAAHASLLPLAATAWSQDWDSAEEDEAWRDL